MTTLVRERTKGIRFSATATEAPPISSEVAAVLSAVPQGVIDGGEIVLLAIRPSMWRPIFDSAAWIVGAGILTAVMTALGKPIPGTSLGVTAQVLLLIVLARLGWATAHWIPRWHVLTNRRIINIEGLRRPTIDSCKLVKIRNTYLRHSTAEAATGLGTILFVTSDPKEPPHAWRSIRDPETVHAKVRRAIEYAFDAHGPA